jgi:hypothetical protein
VPRAELRIVFVQYAARRAVIPGSVSAAWACLLSEITNRLVVCMVILPFPERLFYSVLSEFGEDLSNLAAGKVNAGRHIVAESCSEGAQLSWLVRWPVSQGCQSLRTGDLNGLLFKDLLAACGVLYLVTI